MKLRIQDNSVRFRMTVKELEQLAADGRIERRTQFPQIGGVSGAQFTYGIQVDQGAGDSRIEFSNGAVTAFLSRADIQRLQDDTVEGVYFHFNAESDEERFMFFVEKDRPGSVCDKPEHWIYEESAGKVGSTSPIRKSQAQ